MRSAAHHATASLVRLDLGQSSLRQLTLQVEPAGAEPAALPFLPRHHPEDLELVAIGVLRVQAEAGAMIGLAGEGTGLDQGTAGAGEIGQALHLPRQVVQAYPLAAGRRPRLGYAAVQPAGRGGISG